MASGSAALPHAGKRCSRSPVGRPPCALMELFTAPTRSRRLHASPGFADGDKRIISSTGGRGRYPAAASRRDRARPRAGRPRRSHRSRQAVSEIARRLAPTEAPRLIFVASTCWLPPDRINVTSPPEIVLCTRSTAATSALIGTLISSASAAKLLTMSDCRPAIEQSGYLGAPSIFSRPSSADPVGVLMRSPAWRRQCSWFLPVVA